MWARGMKGYNFGGDVENAQLQIPFLYFCCYLHGLCSLGCVLYIFVLCNIPHFVMTFPKYHVFLALQGYIIAGRKEHCRCLNFRVHYSSCGGVSMVAETLSFPNRLSWAGFSPFRALTAFTQYHCQTDPKGNGREVQLWMLEIFQIQIPLPVFW